MKIKGFDKDLKCRGFQFEVGKTYDTGAPDNKILLCSDTVFHYCDSLEKVHNYYSANPSENNRFCEIEIVGAEVSDGEKCGSNKIKIVREIIGEELNVMRGLKNGNTGFFNTGNYNTGDCNTGNYNTGYYNTGMFNICNYSAGFFCTEEPKARIFDIETDMTVSEFYNSKYYRLLVKHNFTLTEWVTYTEEEKKANKEKELIGGYLKKYTFKGACKIWWDKYSDKEKAEFLTIPNFNEAKFKKITGIEV